MFLFVLSLIEHIAHCAYEKLSVIYRIHLGPSLSVVAVVVWDQCELELPTNICVAD